MKRRILAALLGIMLIFCIPVIPGASETTDVSTTEAVQQTEEEKEPSKTVRIVEFLAIFTVAMGVTAYIVVRPKLKVLKKAQEKTRKN